MNTEDRPTASPSPQERARDITALKASEERYRSVSQ